MSFVGFKQWRWAGACIVLVACTGCGENPFLERVRELSGPAEGSSFERLPNPTLLTVSGDSVSLQAELGERLTLLNLGGTWCPPCAKEMPELQSLHERWSDQGVRVISVLISSPAEDVERWVDQYGLTLRILHEIGSPEWAERISDADAAVPHTLVVDEEAVVRYFIRGYRSAAAIEEILVRFLDQGGLQEDTARAQGSIRAASIR